MFTDKNEQITFIFEHSRLLSVLYFLENEYFLRI